MSGITASQVPCMAARHSASRKCVPAATAPRASVQYVSLRSNASTFSGSKMSRFAVASRMGLRAHRSLAVAIKNEISYVMIKPDGERNFV